MHKLMISQRWRLLVRPTIVVASTLVTPRLTLVAAPFSGADVALQLYAAAVHYCSRNTYALHICNTHVILVQGTLSITTSLGIYSQTTYFLTVWLKTKSHATIIAFTPPHPAMAHIHFLSNEMCSSETYLLAHLLFTLASVVATRAHVRTWRT